MVSEPGLLHGEEGRSHRRGTQMGNRGFLVALLVVGLVIFDAACVPSDNWTMSYMGPSPFRWARVRPPCGPVWAGLQPWAPGKVTGGAELFCLLRPLSVGLQRWWTRRWRKRGIGRRWATRQVGRARRTQRQQVGTVVEAVLAVLCEQWTQHASKSGLNGMSGGRLGGHGRTLASHARILGGHVCASEASKPVQSGCGGAREASRPVQGADAGMHRPPMVQAKRWRPRARSCGCAKEADSAMGAMSAVGASIWSAIWGAALTAAGTHPREDAHGEGAKARGGMHLVGDAGGSKGAQNPRRPRVMEGAESPERVRPRRSAARAPGAEAWQPAGSARGGSRGSRGALDQAARGDAVGAERSGPLWPRQAMTSFGWAIAGTLGVATWAVASRLAAVMGTTPVFRIAVTKGPVTGCC